MTIPAPDSLTAIQMLLDKDAIRESIHRYVRGVDRFQAELIRASYHPDAIDDHGVERTVDEYIEYSMARDQSRSRVHQVGSIIVDLAGDMAIVETYWMAYQAWQESGHWHLRSRCGRYADRFERRDGVWRVALRRVVDDWSAVQQYASPITDLGTPTGNSYPDDVIFTMLREAQRTTGH